MPFSGTSDKLKRKRNTALTIFYLLSAYILLQLTWWGYHIISIHQAVAGENETVHGKVMMIVGEGAVFLIILIIAILFLRKSLKDQMEVARKQNNFLMAVTHELKTPLASVKLNLQTLEKRELSREQTQDITGKAIRETDRLQRLVEEILMASNIEENTLHLTPQKADLSAFLQQLLDDQRHTLLARHKLKSAIPANINALFDRTATTSVCLNLLENAVKYSPQGSTISVLLSNSEKGLLLQVTDEGPGISNSEKKKVFQRFYRSGSELTRKTKGTGLGLFMAKELVALQGGSISVKDNQPQGCIFEVRLKQA